MFPFCIKPVCRALRGTTVVLLLMALESSLETSFSGRQARAAACGFPKVDIAEDIADRSQQLCETLADVRAYFAKIGLPFNPEFSARWTRDPLAAGSVPSHGSFDPLTGELLLHDSAAARPWGMDWSPAIAAAFLRHELVHMAIRRTLGHKSGRLRKEWHEFIAYAVQLDLMENSLRERILARFPDREPFENLLHVNEFTYGMDPDRFAVLAYTTYLARGGPEFVRQLLAFEIKTLPKGEITPPH